MKYDEAGTYELTYKATDECGNEATRARTIIVEEAGADYPYTIATVGAFSTEGGAEIEIPFTDKVTYVRPPKKPNEQGEATIENLVVNGEELGQQVCFANVSETSDTGILIDADAESFSAQIYIELENGELSTAYVRDDEEDYNMQPFSWDSITIVMTEGVE